MKRFLLAGAGLVFLTGCASNQFESRRVAREVQYTDSSSWQPADLATGPVALFKGLVSLPLCPLRLTSETINTMSASSSSSGSKAMEVVTLPVRAVVDGVLTGAVYVVTGVVDTLSGGTLSATETFSRQDEPNSEISCVLAGTSSET